jgi:hypothetical protein
MHRYRLLKQPVDYEELIQTVYDRQVKREVDELKRLDDLSEMFQADRCYCTYSSFFF